MRRILKLQSCERIGRARLRINDMSTRCWERAGYSSYSFTILDPWDPLIDFSELRETRRSCDLEAIKLWEGRSWRGNKTTEGESRRMFSLDWSSACLFACLAQVNRVTHLSVSKETKPKHTKNTLATEYLKILVKSVATSFAEIFWKNSTETMGKKSVGWQRLEQKHFFGRLWAKLKARVDEHFFAKEIN